MLFDSWIDYGQPHATYVSRAFERPLAVVAGWPESMGMALAEAQVAGACIVASAHQVSHQVLVPDAAVDYEAGDVASLARALRIAKTRDPARIRERARQHFALRQRCRANARSYRALACFKSTVVGHLPM
jgi:glycosyltransferase involved in cell wall biosynthesis